jgi:hypothetical protein
MIPAVTLRLMMVMMMMMMMRRRRRRRRRLIINSNILFLLHLMGDMRIAYKFLVRKSERTRPRHRWKDNIRMDLWYIRWEVFDWSPLAQVVTSGKLL